MPRIKPNHAIYAARDFSHIILAALNDTRTTRAELAARLKVTTATLRAKIDNPDTFTAGQLRALCEALEIAPAAIIKFLEVKHGT